MLPPFAFPRAAVALSTTLPPPVAPGDLVFAAAPPPAPVARGIAAVRRTSFFGVYLSAYPYITQVSGRDDSRLALSSMWVVAVASS
eukprot:scaffold64414_cov31-Tisochrysis_lutea.AAC.1